MKQNSLRWQPLCCPLLPFTSASHVLAGLSVPFVTPFALYCSFWWVLCPSNAPYLWLWLLSGYFFSHLCLLSLFLATSAVNVFCFVFFLLEAHFLLAFTRVWRTRFLGFPAHWLLSLHILAVLDISSLGDSLSLSP